MSTPLRRTFDSRPPVLFDKPGLRDAPLELAGESATMRRLRVQIEHIGPHFRTLLIQGETGTGKEVVARALHARSPGAGRSFVTAHGSTLTKHAEDDLGAITSPRQRMFATGAGTIYVDGVDALSLRAQERLLEILERMEAGARSHARVIASTAENLSGAVSAGRFRTRLHQRLATVEIVLEPLRKRVEDIPALTEQLLNRFAEGDGRKRITMSPTALQVLKEYSWPGNLRELENVLRNAVLRCETNVLHAEHLAPFMGPSPCEPLPSVNRIERLEEIVERHVSQVLHLCSGNKVRAAELLGISRSTLYRMLEGMEERDG